MTEGQREKTKLLATFWNNLAVGCFLGGFLIPFLAIGGDPIKATIPIRFLPAEPFKAMVLAFALGLCFRVAASHTMDRLDR